jgi:hypothetical protein
VVFREGKRYTAPNAADKAILTTLGIPAIPHVFSDSRSLITSIQNRIYRGTAVPHSASNDYLAADMARDGEIAMSYILTAEMLTDCLTKPLPKSAYSRQCSEMGMIGIGLGNGLGFRTKNGLRNGLSLLGNGHGNGIGIGTRKGSWTALRK